MHYRYIPQGVCSTCIDFDIVDDKVYNVVYQNGCNGNLKAIGKLCEGMDAAEIVRRLKGVQCGYKTTSCSDQLATAIESACAEAAK